MFANIRIDGKRAIDKIFVYLLDYKWEVGYPLHNIMQKKGGFTVLEVLISAGLFTIVVLGISQTVLTMHRYARSNLCKMQAHLFAVSIFEQLLYDTHPYEVGTATNDSISLRDLGNPNSRSVVLRANNATSNTSFTRSVYEANDLSIELKLTVQTSPLYNDYGTKSRTEINPPEGFQSLRLVYSWATPTVTDLADKSTWFSNELYAIRPINPDDPDYDV
jgi:Tfp pilus assembly protein PilV